MWGEGVFGKVEGRRAKALSSHTHTHKSSDDGGTKYSWCCCWHPHVAAVLLMLLLCVRSIPLPQQQLLVVQTVFNAFFAF